MSTAGVFEIEGRDFLTQVEADGLDAETVR